jgi:hypothetical protein
MPGGQQGEHAGFTCRQPHIDDGTPEAAELADRRDLPVEPDEGALHMTCHDQIVVAEVSASSGQNVGLVGGAVEPVADRDLLLILEPLQDRDQGLSMAPGNQSSWYSFHRGGSGIAGDCMPTQEWMVVVQSSVEPLIELDKGG